ncbi:MAG: hypothetical protein QOF39_772 [Frankiales bacterium]|nr:hypothetical protein [Frankiales bacterium]
MPNRLAWAAGAAALATSAAVALLPGVGGAVSRHPLRSSLHVDFGTRTGPPAHGYALDYGQPYSSSRGLGWTRVANGKPVSVVGNGVVRSSPKDLRYRSFVQMQAQQGPVRTPVQWQVALVNGMYDVTVAVGDAGATNSVDRITAQPHTARQVVLVGGFVPTARHRFFTVTKRVLVTGSRLVLSPAGGRNTKIDFVVASRVRDKVRPSVTVSLTGSAAGAGLYTGPVRVSLSARDNAGGTGVKAVTYQLDGAPARPYTTPFLVDSVGVHTLTAQASDLYGNVGADSVSWTEQAAGPPGTVPTTAPPTTTAPAGGIVDVFTQGGTVSASCAVTGLDGVLPNTAGNQCAADKIAFVPAGLQLTSTAGQLANDDQQNALYKTFDAGGGNFTVTARVVGPVTQLTKDYQQIGAWFGPDQLNFVKVEAEHNGAGAPHLTMFYRHNGTAGIVGTISVPGLTTANTLDLVIKAANQQLTVFYSLNGAALVQVGTGEAPAEVASWFGSAAKAGILVSNSGSTSSFVATFSSFSIAPG